MTRRITKLAQRRHLLLAKIAVQRSELAALSGNFERPLAWADKGLRTARYLHDHPAVLAGGLAAFMALRRGGLLGLAKTSWRFLYLYPSILTVAWQTLSPLLHRDVAQRETETNLGA